VSFLKLLGLERSDHGRAAGDPALEAIAQRLGALPRERALMVAAFAAVLARVARADLQVSPEETARMNAIVLDFGGLDPEEARLVVEAATHGSVTRGAAQDYLATRELKRLAGAEERRRLLECLFAVCAADDSISLAEEQEVRQVASELGFELKEFTAARGAFRHQRELLRGLPHAK
jgi:uncharacterized tellurite resistance protein B-like protein